VLNLAECLDSGSLDMRRPKSVARPRRQWWIIAVLVAIIAAASYQIGWQAWGSYHLAAARRAEARRDFLAAEASLERCFRMWPDDPELHLLAGRLARRKGQTAAVRGHLLRCLHDPAVEAAAVLESSLLEIQSANLSRTGDLERFCREHPDTDEAAWIAEALIVGNPAALETKQALRWLAWWEVYRKNTPDRVQGWLWRAEACVLSHDLEGAREACRRAVAVAPQHRAARLQLAHLLASPDPDEAALHVSAVLAEHPTDLDALRLRARVQRNLGRSAEAGKTLDQVLALDPDSVEALVERGLVCLDLGQTELAQGWLDRAESLAPKHRTVLLARIDYLRHTGQTAELARYQERFQAIEADLKRRLEQALQAQARQNHGSSPGVAMP
jgi:tetratricopeptide (TPR) repeat protein